MLERSGADSRFFINVDAEADMSELIAEGAEPLAMRARAMLEEQLKPLLLIDWAGLRKVLHPTPPEPPAANAAPSADAPSAPSPSDQ